MAPTPSAFMMKGYFPFALSAIGGQGPSGTSPTHLSPVHSKSLRFGL